MYTCNYDSPLGKILLACDDEWLTRLQFTDSEHKSSSHTILDAAKRWLDVYFAGNVPDCTPPLALKGTDFQLRVWECLRRIPYGHTTTYKAIAQELSCRAAQAVGQAVAHNPIAVIIPCHRVIAADGSLTGYAGGIDRKAALLKLEGVKI